MEKIGKNQARDLVQIAALQALGWRVLVIWECAIRSMKKQKTMLLVDLVGEWLVNGSKCLQLDEARLKAECSTTKSVTIL